MNARKTCSRNNNRAERLAQGGAAASRLSCVCYRVLYVVLLPYRNDLLHIPSDARKPDCSLGYAFITVRDGQILSEILKTTL